MIESSDSTVNRHRLRERWLDMLSLRRLLGGGMCNVEEEAFSTERSVWSEDVWKSLES